MLDTFPLDVLVDLLANTTADQWTSGQWLRAITSPYNNLLGQGLVGTILAGSLILSFYIYNGTIVMPSILVLLLGGLLTTVLPGAVVGLARTMIIIGLATTFLAVARRYVY